MELALWIPFFVSSILLCIDGAKECDGLYPKCSGKLDLVMIVDSSGSIDYANWDLVKQYITDIANSFTEIGEDGLKMSVIKYSNNATVEWDLSGQATLSREQLLFRISNLELDAQFTNIVDALDEATKVFAGEGNRQNVPDTAIFMTDGRLGFKKNLFPEAAAGLQDVAHVFSVGVSPEINATELMQAATDGKNGFFHVDNFQELVKLVPKLIQAICPEDDLIKCIRINAANGVSPILSEELDLVLMVDAGGSVGSGDWELVKQYMTDIANSFTEIGELGLKMSVILFSSNASLEWDLSSPTTLSREQLLLGISNLQRLSFFTNIVQSLEVAKEVFEAAGNREGVPDIAILLTDGRDNFNPGGLQQAAADLQEVAHVISVGVSSSVDLTALAEITSDEDNRVFYATDFDELDEIVPQLVEDIEKILAQDNIQETLHIFCGRSGVVRSEEEFMLVGFLQEMMRVSVLWRMANQPYMGTKAAMTRRDYLEFFFSRQHALAG